MKTCCLGRFYNYNKASNSQSFGRIYNVEDEAKEETSENYKSHFFFFNWNYQNAYDSKSGTAQVRCVYLVNRKKYLPEFSLNQTIELDDNTKFFIDYLSLLKKIEKHYRIRFKEVTSITNEDFKTAQKIVFSINRERQKVDIPEGIELSGVLMRKERTTYVNYN